MKQELIEWRCIVCEWRELIKPYEEKKHLRFGTCDDCQEGLKNLK